MFAARGPDEPAVLDVLGYHEPVGDLPDQTRRALHDDYLETIVGVEMDVSRGHDEVDVLVLKGVKALRQFGRLVIVDKGEHPDCFCLFVFPFLGGEPIADQIADGLRAISIAHPFDQGIESPEQFRIQGDPKASDF